MYLLGIICWNRMHIVIVYIHVIPREPNGGEMAPTQLFYYVITAVNDRTHADRKVGIFFVIQRFIQIRVGRFQQIFGIVFDDAPEQFRLVRFGSENKIVIENYATMVYKSNVQCWAKFLILLKNKIKCKSHYICFHYMFRQVLGLIFYRKIVLKTTK